MDNGRHKSIVWVLQEQLFPFQMNTHQTFWDTLTVKPVTGQWMGVCCQTASPPLAASIIACQPKQPRQLPKEGRRQGGEFPACSVVN